MIIADFAVARDERGSLLGVVLYGAVPPPEDFDEVWFSTHDLFDDVLLMHFAQQGEDYYSLSMTLAPADADVMAAAGGEGLLVQDLSVGFEVRCRLTEDFMLPRQEACASESRV